MKIYDLKTEYLTSPDAIDSPNPRFSWKIASDKKAVMQKSYRITARTDDEILWDSGEVFSDESRFIKYEGKPLRSRQEVSWQVCVTCTCQAQPGETEAMESVANATETMEGAGSATVVIERAVSDTAHFKMGLLTEDDWKGVWITAKEACQKNAEADLKNKSGHGGESNFQVSSRKPAPYLRKSFCVHSGLKSARIYETAHGLYESFMNGVLTDEDKFKPGLTSYYYRIQYQTYDITALLKEGENVWAVILADGWWRGSTGGSVKNNFGYTLDYLGQIELYYENGSVEIIGTDESFKTATGALLASDMLMGDIVDPAREPVGWKTAGFDDSAWAAVAETALVSQDAFLAGLLAKKIPSRSVPVRELEHFPGRAFRDHHNDLVVDFGQNIAGYVDMTFHNTKPGQKIVVTHGETLDHDGNFTIANVDKTSLIIDAFQQITYICKGAAIEKYKPSFSIFGFRYIKIEGYEGPVRDGDFISVAVYSAMEETARFECSNPLINKLVQNSLWSQKGNFMDVPVDCPTRERNAWTGDAQVYVRCANIFMDGYTFYEKWLQDQTLEQYASGKVGITFPSTSSVHNPNEIAAMKLMNPTYELAGPTGNGNIGEDSTGWGDAAVWLPYSVYMLHGDAQILANQYETAKKWLEFELACAREDNENYTHLPQYHTYEDGVKDADFIFDTKFHYGEWNEAIGIKEMVESSIEAQIAQKQEDARKVMYFLQMKAKEGNAVVATAYMARSAMCVAHMAKILGKAEEAAHYGRIYEKIKRVYNKYLIGVDGEIEAGHQAPYVRVLAMKLFDQKTERLVVSQLLKEVEAADYCLNTGFLSTPFLLPVLCDYGYVAEAFRILENEALPGWLYPIKKGLTTIPESWGEPELLEASLNHYSYGAVCEFIFQYIAGIRPMLKAPGYKEFELKPVVGGSLTSAAGMIKTHFGTIESAWKLVDGRFHYHCAIPVNTTARLELVDGSRHTLGSGTYDFEVSL